MRFLGSGPYILMRKEYNEWAERGGEMWLREGEKPATSSDGGLL